MLQTLLDALTTEQRQKLHEFGIPNPTITQWKTGKRMPTEVQVVALAEVCGVDRHELQDEVALLRATPEQRTILERILGKAKAVVAGASLGFLASLFVAAAGAGASMDLDKAFAARLRRRR